MKDLKHPQNNVFMRLWNLQNSIKWEGEGEGRRLR
jgi:hypothetical protein